jgi:glycosyltransferase involved in cell wall biosynthesis
LIGIFRPDWVTGGAERYLASMCEFLSKYDDVRFITLRKPLQRYLEAQGFGHLHKLFEQWPADSREIERLTSELNLFVNAASGFLIRGRARENWLVVFSPGPPDRVNWRTMRGKLARLARRIVLSGCEYSTSMMGLREKFALYPVCPPEEALASYQRLVAISRYVASAIERKWHIGSNLLYPAVDTSDLKPRRKRPIIVSVGRFAPYGNQKNQHFLIDAFRSFHACCPDWTLQLVGGLADNAPSKQYFSMLKKRAETLPISFHPNAPWPIVKGLYETASFFWHAAGLGSNCVREPDRVEQFGIAVVEAMAAGTVPLVFGAGGPGEIVENGINGITWTSLADLVDQTAKLISSPERFHQMSCAAVERSRYFDFGLMERTLERWTSTATRVDQKGYLLQSV